MGIIENLAEEMGMQILKKAPEYGAKFILGTIVGVGVHFASKIMINEINNIKKQKEQGDVVEA